MPREADETTQQVTVFAAASTAPVLHQAGDRFTAKTGIKIRLSLGASSTLARQIVAGAPADVFLSANQLWMDEAVEAGAALADTRRDLLTNSLVLIAPAGHAFEIDMDSGAEPQTLAHRRIAVGDPAHVPAGQYAQQALIKLGWWDDLKGQLIPTLDARAALRLVEIGEADAGIVYHTDAQLSDRVVIIAAFPDRLHAPIHYPIARCSESPHAAAFIEFLAGDEMAGVFEDAGFRVLGTPPQAPLRAPARGDG